MENRVIIKPLVWTVAENLPNHPTPSLEQALVPLPHYNDKAKITIDKRYYNEYYTATLWCGNQGYGITKDKYPKTINECKDIVSEYWYDFVMNFIEIK